MKLKLMLLLLLFLRMNLELMDLLCRLHSVVSTDYWDRIAGLIQKNHMVMQMVEPLEEKEGRC